MFCDKYEYEAHEYFDYLANTTRNWATTGTQNPEGKPNLDGSGKTFPLHEMDDVNARLTTLTKRVEEVLEAKKVNVNEVTTPKPPAQQLGCFLCDSMDHEATTCPQVPVFKEFTQVNAIGHYQRGGANPFSNTYNPGRRDHPNFGWRNEGSSNNQQFQGRFQNPPMYQPHIPTYQPHQQPPPQLPMPPIQNTQVSVPQFQPKGAQSHAP